MTKKPGATHGQELRASVAESGCHAIARSTASVNLANPSTEARYEAAVGSTGPLERMTGRIAHDFNNLLSVITSSADLIQLEIQPGDPMIEPLREIQLAVRHGAELVEMLAAFGRQQFLQPLVVDLNDQAIQIRDELQHTLGERISLKLGLGSEPVCARIDPAQFRRALLHLVRNAGDAMPNGGTLTIDVEPVDVIGFERVNTGSRPTACVMVAVSDTGVGMDERTRAQAFEPFFTTKEGGTGMGLPSVRGIVEQSGGAIWLDTARNEGTTVAIYFPRVTSAEVGARDATVVTSAASRVGSKQVLLVDDDAAVRRALARLLRADGFSVVQASSPSEALEIVHKRAARIGLVVTDVVMPEMSGVHLADRLRALNPDIGVLFISGHAGAALADPDQASRCVPFLQKPVRKDELIAAVRTALERRTPSSSPGFYRLRQVAKIA